MKRIVLALIVCYAIFCPLIVLNFALPSAENAFPSPTYNISQSGIPENYYTVGILPPMHSTLDLDFLSFLSEIEYPHEYEADIFDCSESAAFLECYLENLGYDAVIMVGSNSSENQKQVHAWVEVRNLTSFKSGRNLTTMQLDRLIDHPVFSLPRLYYTEDQTCYEDVFAACEACWSCDQWDWWNAI